MLILGRWSSAGTAAVGFDAPADAACLTTRPSALVLGGDKDNQLQLMECRISKHPAPGKRKTSPWPTFDTQTSYP
jgi:hypothetical protein